MVASIDIKGLRPSGSREITASAWSSGFCESELERLAICLGKLMAHVRRSEVAITGGVAIQLGLAEAGHAGGRTAIADLDLVATSLDAIAPTVSQIFLVSHYHVAQPGVPKFMVQLLDPVSRIRVDVFPDLVGSLARARMTQIGAQTLKVLAFGDIFEHKAQTILKASAQYPVDPKHAEDAYALGNVLSRPIPVVRPECLAKDVYGVDADVFCGRCQLSINPHFPIARKEDIIKLLNCTLQPITQANADGSAPSNGNCGAVSATVPSAARL